MSDKNNNLLLYGGLAALAYFLFFNKKTSTVTANTVSPTNLPVSSPSNYIQPAPNQTNKLITAGSGIANQLIQSLVPNYLNINLTDPTTGQTPALLPTYQGAISNPIYTDQTLLNTNAILSGIINGVCKLGRVGMVAGLMLEDLERNNDFFDDNFEYGFQTGFETF